MNWRDVFSQRKRVAAVRYEFLPPFTAWDAGPELAALTWEWPNA